MQLCLTVMVCALNLLALGALYGLFTLSKWASFIPYVAMAWTILVVYIQTSLRKKKKL
jgi:hypothetical protein